MKVYLAGPMRNIPEFNHPAFNIAARLLRNDGHDVFSPAEHDRALGLNPAGMRGDQAEAENVLPLRKVFAEDLAWICAHAEAVVLMPGWELSSGCRAEIAVARVLSIPVYELAGFLLYQAGAEPVAAL